MIEKFWIGNYSKLVLSGKAWIRNPFYLLRHSLFLLLFLSYVLSGCAGGGVVTAHQKDGSKGEEHEKEAVPRVNKPRTVQQPGWVLGKGHTSYPLSQFVIGVGFSGTNQVSANGSARAELAKSLKVELKSIMKDISTETWNKIEQVISTEAKALLEGVEIRDGWYDPDEGVYYSLAIIERKLLAASFRDQISRNTTSLRPHLEDGMKAEENGEIISALNHYLAGYKSAQKTVSLKNALRVVLRSTEPPEDSELSPDTFTSHIDAVVQNLKFTAISGDNQSVTAIKKSLQPFVVRLSLERSGKSIPAQNLPIIFKFEKGSGEMADVKSSNSAGEAETFVQKINSYNEDTHRVSAKLDYSKIISNFDKELAQKFLSPLKNLETAFSYAIKTLKYEEHKPQGYSKGIHDLVTELLNKSIPPQSKLGVFGLKDQRKNTMAPYSRVLKEDIRNALAKVPDIEVSELSEPKGDPIDFNKIATDQGRDFYITGSFSMKKAILELKAEIRKSSTDSLFYSAEVAISREDLSHEDLAMLGDYSEPKQSPPALASPNYNDHLEKIVGLKSDNLEIKLKIWTEKKEYSIGENITFYAKAEQNCYLNLFDISPNGNITVIYPNPYSKDNFLRAGVTYSIPGADYGFKFDVQGPEGLERIKAVASLKPVPLLDVDSSREFQVIEKGSTRGTRTLNVVKDKVSAMKSTEWADAYMEVFIVDKQKTYSRGSRKIPLVQIPKKPIDMIGSPGSEEINTDKWEGKH